ncbi:MAG: 4'-phosphopantetheinyl transferase superfamily protein [Syntrophales bacterium]|nr:4'-phosphopantetheinyl transferase superfamily protein [Syntrophales bacterium]MCK9528764.1 4'-phosphopantetheinyl transferase superfamily protein [Syntrophales bacterium]MDX9922496.1 4'-phosphopantetheinyl transferase superfamily protein [Syntrophales bacterium]
MTPSPLPPSSFLVGNDIVDLNAPHAGHRHHDARFMKRVFTDEEARRISASADPHRHLWSLWAAKETAYKIMVKVIPDIPAWPGRYETFLAGPMSEPGFLEGVVRSLRGSVVVRVYSGDGHVHCIGTSGRKESLDEILHGTGQVLSGRGGTAAASATARRLIIEELSHESGISSRRMCIVRPGGSRGLLHPLLLIDGKPSAVDISISHDGLFTAYARAGRGEGR